MRNPKYHLYLTPDERRIVINSLIDLRNVLISQGRYLIFSDSRQQAAYFASYFDGTYHNILRRRVLIEILKNNRKSYEGGVSVKRLCEDLYAAFNLYQIFDEDDREKEAYKTIIYEMVSNDRHGLEGLGIIRFSFNTEIHIGVFRNNETQAVINVLADSFRRDICLYYDNICTLTPEDKTFFQYAAYDKGYVLNPADKTDYNYCWLAKVNDNYRTSFLKRLSKEKFTYMQHEFLYNHGEGRIRKFENGEWIDLENQFTTDIVDVNFGIDWWCWNLDLCVEFDFDKYPDIVNSLHKCVRNTGYIQHTHHSSITTLPAGRLVYGQRACLSRTLYRLILLYYSFC